MSGGVVVSGRVISHAEAVEILRARREQLPVVEREQLLAAGDDDVELAGDDQVELAGDDQVELAGDDQVELAASDDQVAGDGGSATEEQQLLAAMVNLAEQLLAVATRLVAKISK